MFTVNDNALEKILDSLLTKMNFYSLEEDWEIAVKYKIFLKKRNNRPVGKNLLLLKTLI